LDDVISNVADLIVDQRRRSGPTLLRAKYQPNPDRAPKFEYRCRTRAGIRSGRRKFQPQRQWRLPGIEIDNAAADGELSPGGDLGDTFITAACQLLEKAFHLRSRSAPELDKCGFQNAAPWCGLLETCPRCHYDERTGSASDLH
jgi:hypothetical protein